MAIRVHAEVEIMGTQAFIMYASLMIDRRLFSPLDRSDEISYRCLPD